MAYSKIKLVGVRVYDYAKECWVDCKACLEDDVNALVLKLENEILDGRKKLNTVSNIYRQRRKERGVMCHQRVMELEIERDSALQDAREWKETNEQNYKAYTQYYKECDKLEYELRNKGRKNAELQATNDELRNRIKKLESSQSKWISVEDRLPEHFGWVIGCDGDSNVFPVWYEAETKCFTFNAIPCATTHWQPLPPKSGIDDA